MTTKKRKYTVNVLCVVTLTAYGVEVLCEKGGAYKFDLPCWNEKKKELKTELWDLMKIFGECLFMGNKKIPFVKNEITIIEEEV